MKRLGLGAIFIFLMGLGGMFVFVTATSVSCARPGAQATAGGQANTSGMTGLQWGMFQEGAPAQLGGINQLSSTLGRKPQILQWYVNWGETLSASDLQAAKAAGATPMVTWEAHNQPLPGIAAGQFDSTIDAFANTAKGANGTVYVRIFHEFNDPQSGGGGYPWTQAGKDGSQLVAAWRHTVDRFRADGATNVQWVWNPDGDSNNNKIQAGSYPGDSYVDFTGFDWYEGSATPLAQDYQNVAKFAPSKPMILGEVGASSASVVQGWQQAISGGQVPNVHAMVWFDSGKTRLEGNGALDNAVKALLASQQSGMGAGPGLSAEQQQNAQAIIGEVKAEGLPQQAAVVAIATALAESGLRNLPNGDRDSVGLFQQRPSQGWGTVQQILNPQYATSKFLAALKGLGNWAGMSVEAAAQAVQKSGNPSAYSSFASQAQQIVQQLWGGAAATAGSPPGGQASAPGIPAGLLCPGSASGQVSAGLSGGSASGQGLPWPVQNPIPAPGWRQQIPVPKWPGDLPGSKVSPPQVTNQCVAGALWTWATMHDSDPKFAKPPALGVEFAFQMVASAQAAGYRMDTGPHVGDMVVFNRGPFYSTAGHVGTVIATQGDRYEVIEQNLINDSQILAPQWGTFDIRSIAWPDSQAEGFIAAPPGA